MGVKGAALQVDGRAAASIMGGAQHETLCRIGRVKETSICIVDEAGRICGEMKVASHPEDLLAVLCDPAWRLERAQ